MREHQGRFSRYSQEASIRIDQVLIFNLIFARYKFAQSMKEKKALIFSKFQVQNAYSTALLESIAYSFEVESFSYN